MQTPFPLSLLTGLALCSAFCLTLTSCYSELEDEEQYRTLLVNTNGARTPNVGPNGKTTPTPPQTSTSTPAEPGCDAFTEVLTAENGCGGAACHGAGVQGLVDLGTQDGLEARLLDVASPFCSAMKYIDSSEPTKSMLLDKLGAAPGCGATMPLGKTLTAEQTSCLTAWVNAVASGAQ